MQKIKTIALLAVLGGMGLIAGSQSSANAVSGLNAGDADSRMQTASLLIPAKTRLIIAYSRVATA